MTHPAFPEDLLQAQADWYRTYRQLADTSGTQTAALRRRLLQLSARIAGHPFWEQTSNGPAARMALKQMAWSTTVEFTSAGGLGSPGGRLLEAHQVSGRLDG